MVLLKPHGWMIPPWCHLLIENVLDIVGSIGSVMAGTLKGF
jgi:hypothetical protein